MSFRLNMDSLIHTLTLAFVLAFTSSTHAAVITINNHGFEDLSALVDPGNEFHFGLPTGWSFYDPNTIVAGGIGANGIFTGTLQPNGVDFFNTSAPEEDQVAILFGFGNAGSAGNGEYGLQQILGAVLEANTQYVLDVEVGNIGSGTDSGGTFFDLSGFPGYRVELLAGNTVIAVDDNSLNIPEFEFRTSTLSFNSGANHALLGQSLGIRLVNLNTQSGTEDIEVDFDNVRLMATTIPEPATVMLVGLGLVGMGLGKRKRS